MEREPERRREAVRASLDQRNQKPGRERELVTAWVPHKQDASALWRSPLGGNANSTGKCKCKEALRALCANSRPGSAAPRCCRAPRRPCALGCALIHFAVTSRAGAGRRGAARVSQGHRGLRGPGPWPCLMEQKTDQQKQGRWGRRGEHGHRDEVRGKVAEARRKGCWAWLWVLRFRLPGGRLRPPDLQFSRL